MDTILRNAVKAYEKLPCKETATTYWLAWSRVTPGYSVETVDCYEKAVKLLSMKGGAPNEFRRGVDERRIFNFLKKLLLKYPEQDVLVNDEYYFLWEDGAHRHCPANYGYDKILKKRPITALTAEERQALIEWFRRKKMARSLNVNLPRHNFLAQALQNRNSVLWYWEIRSEPGYGEDNA